jgi:hypothetical protein
MLLLLFPDPSICKMGVWGSLDGAHISLWQLRFSSSGLSLLPTTLP